MGSYLDKLLGGLKQVWNNGVHMPVRPNVNLIGMVVQDNPALNSTDCFGAGAVITTTASFTQPAAGASVQIFVTSTAGYFAGLGAAIQGGGSYSIASIDSGTTMHVTNLGVAGNASPGATITGGAIVVATGTAIAPASVVSEIRFPIGLTSVSSTASLPASALSSIATISIETAYSSGTTIQLGQTGATSSLQTIANNDPMHVGLYSTIQDTPMTANQVLATIGGSPTVGSGHVILQFIPVPLS